MSMMNQRGQQIIELDPNKKYSLRIDGGDELHYSDSKHILEYLSKKYGVQYHQIQFELIKDEIYVGIYTKFGNLMRYVGFLWENY